MWTVYNEADRAMIPGMSGEDAVAWLTSARQTGDAGEAWYVGFAR